MSSYNVKNGNRGLKAFIAVVCVLLVVSIVGSILVLWRTTNGFKEFPEFENSDEENFLVEDDTVFNSLVESLSLDISDSITSFSSDVLESKEVTVSSSMDLSQFYWSWFLDVDDSAYYDDCWHDVLGYEFDGDFEIGDYVRLTDKTFDSVLVEFLDYFPSTIYLYYYLSNGVDEIVARCLVDCVCDVEEFSVYTYIGDLEPSFQCTNVGSTKMSVGFNSFSFKDIPFHLYYDGLNCYNCLFFGCLDFFIGDVLDFRGFDEVFYYDDYLTLFNFCSASDGGLLDFSSCSSSTVSILLKTVYNFSS